MALKKTTPWPRAIILVDMNAFFASIEQMDFPELRGQPVVITNGRQGSCIITSSYEARRFGVKTGMRLYEARELCPEIIQCAARPKRYAELSTTIMEALNDITPDLEVFSVDEAFLDVSRCQRLLGSPIDIARRTKERVLEVSGLPCSVGVSGDKTTAKYAAKLHKPDGFEVIYPWEAKARLRDVPVTELCGIAKGIGRFLASYGVICCGDIEKIPISILAKRFGNLGRRIWYMCQGADPEPLCLKVAAPKSIGHGKVIPPNTTNKALIEMYLLHMSEKVAARLRRHQMAASHFFIGLRGMHWSWIVTKERLAYPCADGRTIYQLCQQFMKDHWHGEPVSQVQITALDPRPDSQQLDLFIANDSVRRNTNNAVDTINQHFGEFTIAPARLLGRSSMPNVISPAWKPFGHRQSI